ncbi:immunity 8 family protein [Paenibacillus radicis (ex Xue et al. 2023)]|uniref:Immunity 8 family protein n=1 Tax=Paenibacillus radicis (ex Xue et al. 2023) TaxID=2972489 RepID=A0ABT1YBH5_9BACL|nr:immunity 8 family protein [Paenibacillus radicis (ex Xue et al. 2023)]MCR8630542.1 immunity 8 family protein [Paenibacillus radicis (ex Xue et al. 2023)]
MIKPVLKYLDIVQIKDGSKGFLARGAAYIGEEEADGVEYFYFRVMTTDRLHSMLDEEHIIDGRATFIVHTFDQTTIEERINVVLRDSIRPTWGEVALAINRYLSWEYDSIKYETIEEALARINKVD